MFHFSSMIFVLLIQLLSALLHAGTPNGNCNGNSCHVIRYNSSHWNNASVYKDDCNNTHYLLCQKVDSCSAPMDKTCGGILWGPGSLTWSAACTMCRTFKMNIWTSPDSHSQMKLFDDIFNDAKAAKNRNYEFWIDTHHPATTVTEATTTDRVQTTALNTAGATAKDSGTAKFLSTKRVTAKDSGTTKFLSTKRATAKDSGTTKFLSTKNAAPTVTEAAPTDRVQSRAMTTADTRGETAKDSGTAEFLSSKEILILIAIGLGPHLLFLALYIVILRRLRRRMRTRNEEETSIQVGENAKSFHSDKGKDGSHPPGNRNGHFNDAYDLENSSMFDPKSASPSHQVYSMPSENAPYSQLKGFPRISLDTHQESHFMRAPEGIQTPRRDIQAPRWDRTGRY